MNSFWIIAAISLASALPTAVLSAEKEGAQQDRMEKRVDMMSDKLKLSDDQRKTVEAALYEKRDKMKALQSEFVAKRKSLDDETDSKINAVLNAEQKATYSKMREDREKNREDFKDRMKHGRRTPAR
jgi:Spy/CpxP family protein refolding chaperone